ncbi:histidine kinase [Niabella sp. 22666]|uniref:sensor histidine kinase n=1 Tax=Niabella sp. 22666 TaxID=3453954 RepID=UPI003F86CCCD
MPKLSLLLCLSFAVYFSFYIPATTYGQWSFKPSYYQYDASVLGTNTVYRLYEDPYGFIWLVSDKGILVFNGQTFETIKIPEDEQEIVNVCRYKNIVYASSYAGRLYEIDMFTLVAKEISLPEPAASEATPFLIMNVLDDKLYLSRGRGSFLILDLRNNKKPLLISHSYYLLRYLLHGDTLKEDTRFFPWWFKILDDKIFSESTIYNLKNRTLSIFYTAGNEARKLKQVSSYLYDSSDFYVGFLQSGGLVKYTDYKSSPEQNISQAVLPNVEVGDILKDHKGNIWVSTMHDGVFVFLAKGRKVKKISALHNMYSNDIWYVRYKNKILDIGYKQLMVEQFKNRQLYKRWVGDTTINFNPVLFFRNSGNKAIIFGKTLNYTTYKNPKNSEVKLSYKDFYVSNGEIYATLAGGFRKFSKDLNPISYMLNVEKFNTIFLLADSVFAKGSPTGLYLNSTRTQIRSRITKVRGYNKDILACSDNGLYIKRGEQYFFIDETKGLPNNQCVQIEYDGGKYYKLLTKGGIAYIDTATCKVAGVFNSSLLGNDVSIRCFDVENDSVWLATNKGIYVLEESLLFNKAEESAIAYLYPEKLNNRRERYTQQVYEMKYSKTKQVKMVLELLDFSSSKYAISYQVENGNDIATEQTTLVNNSFVVYTPEPGTYTVKVFISGEANHLAKTLTYTIKVIPLWYQSTWIKWILTIGIAIILWFIIRFVTRYIIKEKEKRLKEKYAILQLQSQAFFTQLNPHFIFNALTPLQSHILKNEKIESLEYLDRFSSLMRDILKNSDKMETSLKKELNFIKEYIAIQQIRFSPSFIFELTVSETIDLENTSIPAMMLQPIIENAIEHGVKNMGAAGKILVDIATAIILGKDCIQIHISDNGPGITENILKEGHALYILLKRVQTLQKRKGTIASLTYEPNEDGIGTVFKLILPKTILLWEL